MNYRNEAEVADVLGGDEIQKAQHNKRPDQPKIKYNQSRRKATEVDRHQSHLSTDFQKIKIKNI